MPIARELSRLSANLRQTKHKIISALISRLNKTANIVACCTTYAEKNVIASRVMAK
jgi:hypothetical protein